MGIITHIKVIMVNLKTIGAVVLMGKNEKDVVGDAERLLVKTAASFLGRQMEQ